MIMLHQQGVRMPPKESRNWGASSSKSVWVHIATDVVIIDIMVMFTDVVIINIMVMVTVVVIIDIMVMDTTIITITMDLTMGIITITMDITMGIITITIVQQVWHLKMRCMKRVQFLLVRVPRQKWPKRNPNWMK